MCKVFLLVGGEVLELSAGWKPGMRLMLGLLISPPVCRSKTYYLPNRQARLYNHLR